METPQLIAMLHKKAKFRMEVLHECNAHNILLHLAAETM